MADLTVGDIFTRVKDLFGDQDGVQITEAMVIRWINDAQREAVMQHEGLLTTEGFISTVLNQQDYTLPTDLFTLTHLYYKDDDTYYMLRYMPVLAMNKYADGWDGEDYGTGYPVAYTRPIDGTISLFPIPDKSVTNGLKLEYSRYPTDVVDSTSALDLPQYYHSYIEDFVLMRAYELDENWEASDRKAAILQAKLDFNNNRESWFGRDTYPSVIPMTEDYF